MNALEMILIRWLAAALDKPASLLPWLAAGCVVTFIIALLHDLSNGVDQTRAAVIERRKSR